MATYFVDGAVGNDSNAGTAAGAGNAWATISKAFATIAGNDWIWVKNSAIYSIATGLTVAIGTFNAGITGIGSYTTTPGDGGQATIRATAAVVGLTINSDFFRIENFLFDGNSIGTQGVVFSSNHYSTTLVNCKVTGWTAEGVKVLSFAPVVARCEVTGCGGNGGIWLTSTNALITGCNIHGNATSGIYCQNSGTVVNCRIWGNTGASSDGITDVAYTLSVVGNTIHGNGRHGINKSLYNMGLGIFNNILTSNGGYGINIPTQAVAGADNGIDYNWFGTGSLANTSGARSSNLLAGAHDLSGDPQYVNAAAGDFTPQNALVQAGSP